MVALISSGLRPSLEDISAQVEALQADKHKLFMADVRAWASGNKPGSIERLQQLLRDRRADRALHRQRFARLNRVLIVAEILRIKRDRLAADAGLALLAAAE